MSSIVVVSLGIYSGWAGKTGWTGWGHVLVELS
jgi:hypothetical protein